MTAASKPLLYLVQAELRVTGRTERDFSVEPWLEGEGPRFWTGERVLELAKANEALRAARKARQ